MRASSSLIDLICKSPAAAARTARVGLAAIVLSITAMAAAAQSEPAAIIRMTGDLTFEPATVTVPAGSTVKWENTSSIPHTATADPAQAADPERVELPQGAEPFNSGLVQPGGSYTHTFTVPGRYQYFCIPHEAAGMIGTVVVE